MRLGIAVLACLGLTALIGCSGPSGEKAATSRPDVASAKPTLKPTPPPYLYPSPVRGHFEYSDSGPFDLVDGIAYTTSGGGTVVVAIQKAVASPILATSTCPMTQGRALTLIRNASSLEVTLDAAGRSPYFSVDTHYNGQNREPDLDGRYWKTTGGKLAGGRISGKLDHMGQGQFEFDLPISKPGVDEVSVGERVSGRRYDASRRAPTEAEVTAVFIAIRKAALAKDLEGMLVAQGFDAKLIEAVRGLPGIDADLPAHADRFLEPGAPEDPHVEAGLGYVMSKGKNSKGEAFNNYYEFVPCGDKLVLVSIGLNPQ